MIANGTVDPRRTQYAAALGVISGLLAAIEPAPCSIRIDCDTFAPELVEITLNAHMNLSALQAWHSQLGGQLAPKERKDELPYWELNLTVNGIPVRAWTLLELPDADGAQ